MFDGSPSRILGLDLPVFLGVVGVVGLVIGMLAIRHRMSGEGDLQTFRSSSRREPTTVLMFAVAAAAVVGAVVYLAFTLA